MIKNESSHEESIGVSHNRWTRCAGCGRVGRRQLYELCPFIGSVSDPRVVVQEAPIDNTGEVMFITSQNTCSKQYLVETSKPLSVNFRGTTLSRILYIVRGDKVT